MEKHGLSDKQLNIMLDVLAPYWHTIELVGIFGSRATGKYRLNSDIDLVLYGSLDEKTADRIARLFEESFLPVKVDVQVYQYITFEPLKAHIDRVMLPLFTQQDLKQYVTT
jgi:predicted nucleotidyltransferase